MKTVRYLAFATAGVIYALIVLGAFVRITGSGMGCGDDWPLCNGRLIPSLADPATVIEWGHRLMAAAVSVFVFALAAVALIRARSDGGPRLRATGRLALLGVALLLTQVFLGAVTVWLELPPTAVVLHLSTALALLAVVMIVGLRADEPSDETPAWRFNPRWPIVGALGLTALVLLLGGVTANVGAGPACLGFPLCSGAVWPPATESGLTHIHWTHRLLAYALTLYIGGLALQLSFKRAPARIKTAAWVCFGLVGVQVGVAAVMVLEMLPAIWRGLHAAVGTVLWVAVVYLTWLGFEKWEEQAVITRSPLTSGRSAPAAARVE